MAKRKEKPDLFVGWVHKGKTSFEVIPSSMYEGLLQKLLVDKGIHPGAIFISQMTVCHWIAPKYHKGKKTVWIGDFWDEINGINSPAAYYEEPKYSVEKKTAETKYGYISPDGRYFQCEYFGHSSLAREIVGKLEKIDDPAEYLYSRGWLCIYHDPFNRGNYAIAMGFRQHMTEAQLKMLDMLEIPHSSYNFQRYLLGEED